jgi:hypothetical protein
LSPTFSIEDVKAALDWLDVENPDEELLPTHAQVLAAAARRLVSLGEGEKVEWCETHNSVELNGSTCMAWEQAYSETAEPWEVEIDCRMVSRLLVDPVRLEGED